MSIQTLKGVGKGMAAKLARMGIHTVSDLLFHLPLRYEDRSRVSAIRQLVPGMTAVTEGVIEGVTLPQHGKTRLEIRMRDASGRMMLRFFHVWPAQQRLLRAGMRLRCFGEVRRGTLGMEMIHPEYQLCVDSQTVATCLTPVYPATEGVGQGLLRKLVREALARLQAAGNLPEFLPAALLQSLDFPQLADALQCVHFPPADTSLALLAAFRHAAQRRLVFEELLAQRLGLLEIKKSAQSLLARPLNGPETLIREFSDSLPWPLTAAQQKVWADISSDLARPVPMMRLVQGDVGCGKTVVAALAALRAAEHRLQSAVLAPTELLARQHFHTFSRWFEPLGVSVVLLCSQLKTAERKALLVGISSGKSQVIVGTHAIFQRDVVFARLALLVVDEQHRFGVQQRVLLREKGMTDQYCPHQLVLTATPIPRTLAMSACADLDCSLLDEMPPGRVPVITRLMPDTRRSEVIERLGRACLAGQRAYWVCPAIEASEALACEAAEETFAAILAALPTIRVGLLHGRMKPAEKAQIMSAFRAGELQILVATTVIEVGVDVPEAGVMVIENAERLGLSQLHQLRGRTGRGKVGGFCLLMYHAPLSSMARERLAVMRRTTDGFEIAQRDLELRGPGEILGIRQTGEMALKIADFARDSDLLPMVQQAADMMQTLCPGQIPLLVKRWAGNREACGFV